MNQRDISTLTEEEITFLTIVINRGIKEVKPIIGNEGIQYEPLDDILKENNYDWDNIYDLLKAILKKGCLIRKDMKILYYAQNVVHLMFIRNTLAQNASQQTFPI